MHEDQPINADEPLDDDVRQCETKVQEHLGEAIELLRALRAGAGRSDQGRAYSVACTEAEKTLAVFTYYRQT